MEACRGVIFKSAGKEFKIDRVSLWPNDDETWIIFGWWGDGEDANICEIDSLVTFWGIEVFMSIDIWFDHAEGDGYLEIDLDGGGGGRDDYGRYLLFLIMNKMLIDLVDDKYEEIEFINKREGGVGARWSHRVFWNTDRQICLSRYNLEKGDLFNNYYYIYGVMMKLKELDGRVVKSKPYKRMREVMKRYWEFVGEN